MVVSTLELVETVLDLYKFLRLAVVHRRILSHVRRGRTYLLMLRIIGICESLALIT